jgi:hypothetical protein
MKEFGRNRGLGFGKTPGMLLLTACFLCLFPVGTWAQGREIPLDVYIIVDSSSAMEKGKNEAVSWLCDTVIDGILKDGDRVSIWTAGAKSELVYSGAVSADIKVEVKNLITQITFSGLSADYKGALGEALTKSRTSPDKRLTYTLLVSGSNPKDPPIKEAESAGLLLYSRVENFSGWKVLTVGLDIASRVRDSAASYMKNK